jgi:pyruvate, water dikinase
MHFNTLFKYWTYRLFAPGLVLRATYDAFRQLLTLDSRSHELMAELEDLYYRGNKEDFCRIALRYNALSASVGGMVENLERMVPGSFVTLAEYFGRYDFYNRFLLSPPTLHFGPPFVLLLTDDAVQPDLAGTKSATLAEIADTLDLPVPSGFVITVNSFNYILEYNDLRRPINDLLAQIDLTNPDNLNRLSSNLIDLIRKAEIPPNILEAIFPALTTVFAQQADTIRLAVRSSAVGEDGECSFAGQYASVLDVGKDRLVESYRTVLASKYAPEALAYRIHCGLSDEESAMAVLVVRMIDAFASGIVYSCVPTRRNAGQLFIHAVPGQGEALVSGRAVPETLIVDREDLTCHRPERHDTEGVPMGVLTDEQARDLARHALKIESHFGVAQDIEWAMTETGELFILQSRPLQSQSHSPTAGVPITSGKSPEIHGELLLQGGTMVALGQACGPAYCVDGEHLLEQVPDGAILVVKETLPVYAQVLDRVCGVLAGLGSPAGHFSTVCREFSVPMLCGLGEKNQ